MFADLFKIVFKNAQTLRKEDILTALLASMFEISPSMCIDFFSHSYISCPENILDKIKSKCFIKTNVAYYNEFDDIETNYKFRPDLLLTSSDVFSDLLCHHILIESKIYSTLTTNQHKGYPEIKKRNLNSIFILLITNHEKDEYIHYFDNVISWHQTYEIISSYIRTKSTTNEKYILKELLESFLVIGVELHQHIYTELSKNVYPDLSKNEFVNGFIDIQTFVKAMRKDLGLTQTQFAKEIGVGLRFIRDLEQGKKETLRSDKINIVLKKFNCVLAPILIK